MIRRHAALVVLFAVVSLLPCAQVHAGATAGPPAFFPWWYHYDPFYHPRPVPPPVRRRPLPPAEPQPPPAPALPSTEPTYWYCFNTKQYYPETTQCPGGWQQVVPRTPPPPPPE